MATNFPELTSFGTLLTFALALEESAATLLRAALEREECAGLSDVLTAGAKKHDKRHRSLEQLRRERLNEVVLQPIRGMSRDEYLPPLALPAEPHTAVTTIVAAEETAARFYDDAAVIAVNALGGLERTFRRLAQENRALGASLTSLAS